MKWFNWLYLQVTQAVEGRVNSSGPTNPDGFADPEWIAALDVRFANYYLAAVRSSLSGGSPAGCWQALFNVRNQHALARIQLGFAGMNAHINHDLPQAVLAACDATSIAPQHNSTQYSDYTALNTTLDSLISAAKVTLRVRLLGDAISPISSLDDTLAAWSVAAAREAAWKNAELLYHLSDAPLIASAFMGTLDGMTALASKAILVAVP